MVACHCHCQFALLPECFMRFGISVSGKMLVIRSERIYHSNQPARGRLVQKIYRRMEKNVIILLLIRQRFVHDSPWYSCRRNEPPTVSKRRIKNNLYKSKPVTLRSSISLIVNALLLSAEKSVQGASSRGWIVEDSAPATLLIQFSPPGV